MKRPPADRRGADPKMVPLGIAKGARSPRRRHHFGGCRTFAFPSPSTGMHMEVPLFVSSRRANRRCIMARQTENWKQRSAPYIPWGADAQMPCLNRRAAVIAVRLAAEPGGEPI